MEEQGLWALFWATGLPEAWLEARRETDEKQEEEQTLCAAPPDRLDGL